MEQKILEAATHLLETEGPEALSIRRIAVAAQVAPMGVYNHFGSKQGVVDALFRAGFAALGASMADAETLPDPLAAVVEAGWRYREFALAHRALYAVMFLRSIPEFRPSAAAIETSLAAFDGIVRVVQRCLETEQFIEAPVIELAQNLWALVHGAVALELLGLTFTDDAEAHYAGLLAMALDGLRRPTGR